VTLAGNHLTEIPPELGQLKLKRLDVNGNKLTDLPRRLFDMDTLTHLDLQANQLVHIT